MCVVCTEYLKGKLTLEEAERAFHEMEVLGDIGPDTDHDQEAIDKMIEDELTRQGIFDEDDGSTD